MIRKLPKWVEAGGVVLTFIAGSVNVMGLLGFQHQAVSHLTGSSSRLGVSLVKGDMHEIMHLLLIVGFFILGSLLSSVIIGDATLKIRRSYGFALLTEAALLTGAMIFLLNGSNVGDWLASAACGLQNGMATAYSGSVIRTTHVTGLFTDLGVMIGSRLRGVPIDLRRARLYILLIFGFITGSIVGTVTFQLYAFNALLLPIAITTVLAGIWFRFSGGGLSEEKRGG